MSETNTQVPSGGAAVESTPSTQSTSGPVTPQVTPPAPQPDASSQVDLSTLQAQLAKYETDIRNIKSSSDKRINEITNSFSEKENELRRQIQELTVATLDGDAREAYLNQIENERAQEIEQKLNQAESIEQDYQASLQAIAFYTSKGVPMNELVLDQGYDELFQSGFRALLNSYEELKSKVGTASPQVATPPTLPTAPPVATSAGVQSPIGLKPTWDDLHKKYGTDEEIYRAVESGRLPVSLIPN